MATHSNDIHNSNRHAYKRLPPYPVPKNISETQKNIRFFRERTGKTIKQIGAEVGVSYGSWSLWEIDQPSKDGPHPIKAHLLDKVAQVLGCDPDLINPACPLLYKDQYTKYPPLLATTETGTAKKTKHSLRTVFCIEQPSSAKDTINNVDYFCVRSGITNKALSVMMACADTTIANWRKKTAIKEAIADKLHKILDCPKELIYIPKINQPKDGRYRTTDADIKRTKMPSTMKEVKANLAYHVARARLSALDVARILGLPEDESGAQMYINWKNPNISTYMDKSQALILALRLNAPINEIMPIYEQDSDVSKLDANAASLVKLNPSNDILEKKVQSFVSGGAILELEPSQNAETIGDILSLPHDVSNIAAATVVGDSMFDYETGTGIADGTCILIDMSHRDFREEIGNVVCFQVNGNELMVKRLKMIEGDLYFCSDNPCYIPKYHRMPKDATLLGVVVSCLNKVH